MTRSTPLETPAQLVDALEIPFSDEQLAAICAPLEPAVIIAGAGSGKTTVMAARVVWLVGTGQVLPEEVLGLTFTRKAAAELGSRVSAALQRAGVLVDKEGEGAELVMTYDSFAARLVSEFGLRIGLDRDPVMVTGASRYRLAARVVANAPGPFHRISRLSHHNIPERVLSLDAELQSHLVGVAELQEFSERARARFEAAPLWRGKPYKDVGDALAATDERLELLDLVADYQRLKQALGVVEFADQLREAVRLVGRVPDVGRELRHRFRVVLLDEYQDTSSAQAILLRDLFGGSSEGTGFPVTAVGDPYQAIYGWRGAAAGNILEFPHQFPRADGSAASRLTLSVNRRSGQRILDVGNALAAGLHAAPGEDGVSLIAPPRAQAGEVCAATFDTAPDEVAWLTGRIVARHDEGTQWREQAVLVRRNATLTPVFTALRDSGVPVEIVGLGGLLTLPEIAPIVSTLRILDDVTANPDVAALLTGPRWSIGLADLEALGRRSRELAADAAEAPSRDFDAELAATVTQTDPGERPCLLDAVADPGDTPLSPEARRRIARFHAEISGLRRHAGDPVADLVTRVVAVLGLEAELLSTGNALNQVARFVDEVATYVDVDGDGSLSGLLAYLDAEEEHGEGLMQAVVSSEDSVKLMTVHRAKGLEWDTVYLPSLADKVFPSQPRSGVWPQRAESLPSPLRGDADSIPQLAEYSKAGLAEFRVALAAEHRLSEDRLAYVAATRAKSLLVGTTHIWTPGTVRPRDESPYFAVIREAAEERGRYEDHATRGADSNPIPAEPVRAAWPEELSPELLAVRRDAAGLVAAAAALPATREEREAWVWRSGIVDAADAEKVAAWDDTARHLTALLQERGQRRIELPDGLSATALMALRSDPDEFVDSLLRRMPRRPSTAARVGTRFHAWLQERFELPASLEELVPDNAPAPTGLRRLIEAFEQGRFADRVPIGVEVPFLMHRSGVVLRGRIDAVYDGAAEGYSYLVIDWKTSGAEADPLQLAVYRQAWAEARGVDPSQVGAGFYHVAQDRLRLIDAPASLIDAAIAAGVQT
ncbi:ATP-dependent DNA helicase [Tessaracoccus palaemonis]|uniref:DNA 3'-5' helicase n=1 Tax=Tessaracoccus palaemonis TaxID=2829499 RepID=A0ABX8SKG9_9ACTN|nr:ATP-dependent DNA helicase [Tessaracoccus palaemonis]QXT61709.1 ATP-dependent helicase [Tessaracoccus palaemonis]